MHYGHSIKYRYYLDGIFIIQSWEGAIQYCFQIYKHFRHEY
jgi:hypothetical protein